MNTDNRVIGISPRATGVDVVIESITHSGKSRLEYYVPDDFTEPVALVRPIRLVCDLSRSLHVRDMTNHFIQERSIRQ